MEPLQVQAEKVRSSIDVNIFRGYDVRGNATVTEKNSSVNLQPVDAFLIGQALASLYTQRDQIPRVLITSDHRPSSPGLKQGLAEGCAAGGALVYVNVDPVPTGATSWFILKNKDDFDVAVQITGSHNPYYQNGFKITAKQDLDLNPDVSAIPQALYGEKLKGLYYMITEKKVVQKEGKIEEFQRVVPEYQAALVERFQREGKFNENFQVILDAGNGMGAKAIPVLEKLGVKVEPLFAELDGTFPNHPADPSKPEGVQAAQEKVKEFNSSLDRPIWKGLVFDGDGDRAGVIDEAGNAIYPEQILVIIYTRFLLQNEKGFQALADLGETLGLALDVRGSGVIAGVIEYFGQVLALRKYALDQGGKAEEIEDCYRKAQAKMWQHPSIEEAKKLFSTVPENFTEYAKKHCGIVAEYIAAGYPNHRTYVREQLSKLKKIVESRELTKEQKDLFEQIRLQYTSAEASGHFFYATCKSMPEAMVDDGIYTVIELLKMLDSVSKYEVASGLLPQKEYYSLQDLFSAISWYPISREIRGNAPEDNVEKFAIVTEITALVKKESVESTGRFQQKISQIVDVDGIKAEFEDGSFCLVRASNTSPKLTYKFEAPTQKRLVEVMDELISIMETYKDRKVTTSELKKERDFQSNL